MCSVNGMRPPETENSGPLSQRTPIKNHAYAKGNEFQFSEEWGQWGHPGQPQPQQHQQYHRTCTLCKCGHGRPHRTRYRLDDSNSACISSRCRHNILKIYLHLQTCIGAADLRRSVQPRKPAEPPDKRPQKRNSLQQTCTCGPNLGTWEYHRGKRRVVQRHVELECTTQGAPTSLTPQDTAMLPI